MKRLLGMMRAVVVLLLASMAGASALTDKLAMSLVRMNPLAFSKTPVSIESVTRTSEGNFAVIYAAASEKSEAREMRMELFDTVGTSLVSAALGEFDSTNEPFPHAQIILKKKTASFANTTRTLRRWRYACKRPTAIRDSGYRNRPPKG